MRVWRIGFDIDGVGLDFDDTYKAYLDYIGLGHLWKSGPTPEPFWDYFEDFGISRSEAIEHWHHAADLGILYNGPMLPGYAEAIAAVHELDHHVIIHTDRPFGSTPEVSEKITVDWFRDHGVEYDEIWFGPDKTASECDFFVDDKIANYDALVAAGTNAFLRNRKMNKIPGGDARQRIDSIAEYAEAISVATARGHYDLAFA